MSTYSTGQMAKKLGKSTKTIQNWDKTGFLKSQRTPSGRRFYTEEQYLEASGNTKYKCGTNESLDFFNQKVVFISGGTGSLGKALTSRLVGVVKKIIIFSRDELKQAKMKQEFGFNNSIRFLIGDIRDKNRLRFALKDVDIAIHAAALKRVETNTYNPTEGVATNITGTINVAEACIENGVNKALFVSSDKASEPITPYGYMKAMGESCWINFNNYASKDTAFMATRYGNIINSNGSFYHTIKTQIESGKIQITDPDMTRFYMTLDDAVDLNLYAISNSVSGEIFIPKIKAASLMDFVKAFGGEDLPIETIGIRGVEKIAERLIAEHEMRLTYDCGKYYKILPDHISDYNLGWDRFRPKGKPIESFMYTSDSKDVEKLSAQDLVNMVNEND